MALKVQKAILHEGREYLPGSEIPGLSDEHEADLKDRGFLSKGEPEPEAPAETPDGDDTPPAPEPEDLSKLNKAQLLAKAAERSIDVPDKATNKQIVELLEAPAETPDGD